MLLTGMGRMILRYGVELGCDGGCTLTLCRTHVIGAVRNASLLLLRSASLPFLCILALPSIRPV
jgi:hypothetical protein